MQVTLKQMTANLSLRKRGLDLGLECVRFMMDQVKLEQALLRVLFLFILSVLP